jgi:hypothetical protein
MLVAEAMWCWLRRLCVGLTENKANSAFKLGAELGNRKISILSFESVGIMHVIIMHHNLEFFMYLYGSN